MQIKIKSGSVRVPSNLSEVRFVLSNFYSDLETSRKKKRCSFFFFKKECINNNNILLIKAASAFSLDFYNLIIYTTTVNNCNIVDFYIPWIHRVCLCISTPKDYVIYKVVYRVSQDITCTLI